MVTRFYAGIGSRKTPNDALAQMRRLGAELAQRGYVCRSGGALGADTAFEEVTPPSQMALYLPWRGFENHSDGFVVGDDERLQAIAARYHPKWSACKNGARKLHTRNVAQILGHEPQIVLSDFVLCWTERALGGGGTGQAIRIARAYGVPVYDLANPDHGFERSWLR